MRKYLVSILIVSLIIIGGILTYEQKDNKANGENNYNDQGPSEGFQKNKNNENQETLNNLLKHISFAEEALSKFDISSAEKALNLWLEGIESGNGVLQYATMDMNLQQEFKEYLQHEENLSWDTRDDEFKLGEYEIIEATEVSEKIKIYIVKFEYINLMGEIREKINKVTIVEEQGRWSISLIR